jgi:hypothetical protein
MKDIVYRIQSVRSPIIVNYLYILVIGIIDFSFGVVRLYIYIYIYSLMLG